MRMKQTAMEMMDEPQQIVVRGIVVPMAWDVAGNPLGVAVLTADEGEYRIAPRGLGRRLFDCLTEEVVARIVPRRDLMGESISEVVSFTRVGNPDDHGVVLGGQRGVAPPAVRRPPKLSSGRRHGR